VTEPTDGSEASTEPTEPNLDKGSEASTDESDAEGPASGQGEPQQADGEVAAQPEGPFDEAGISESRDAGSEEPDEEAGPASMPDGAVGSDAGRTIFRPGASPWKLVAGSVSMIAVSANGDVWALGTTAISSRGVSVLKHLGEDWVTVPSSGAVNLAVDPSGVPWIIDANGTLARGSDSSVQASWIDVASNVLDIAFGARGDAWLIGNDQNLYLMVGGGFQADGVTRLAVSLAVTPAGVPWIVDVVERVFERSSSSPTETGWTFRHGTGAADISIAPDGTVFVLGDTLGPGGRLAKYLNRDQAWVPLDETVGGKAIAAGPSDLWIVDSQSRIYRYERAALP
jgi:hypothetical protein